MSVFQCQMNNLKKQSLITELEELINHKEDHVLFIDIGDANKVRTRIVSLGKTFEPLEKKPLVF